MMISRKRVFSPVVAGLLACTALTLAGCGLNREPPPRYNTVLGEKRPPVLNPNGQGLSGLPYASAPPYPIPAGPPPYPQTDGQPPEGTVSVVPMPHTPETMAGRQGPMDPMAAHTPTDQMVEMPESGAMPLPPKRENSWYSGVTDWFSDGEQDVLKEQASMPRKKPAGNQAAFEQAHGVRAVPVEPVVESSAHAMDVLPPAMDASATLMDIPADDVAPMTEYVPAPMPAPEPPQSQPVLADVPPSPVLTPAPAPMSAPEPSYPVLADTPPAPEDTSARLEAARRNLQTMESDRTAAPQDFSAALPEPASAPLPEPEIAAPPPPVVLENPVVTAPASGWQPVGEPQAIAAPAPAEPDWESALPPPPANVPEMTQEASLPPLPNAPEYQPEYQSEPVQVVQDVPAEAVETQSGLPPINLIPPPSVVADSAQATVRTRSPYIAPSRYEQRRDVERQSTLRHQ